MVCTRIVVVIPTDVCICFITYTYNSNRSAYWHVRGS